VTKIINKLYFCNFLSNRFQGQADCPNANKSSLRKLQEEELAPSNVQPRKLEMKQAVHRKLRSQAVRPKDLNDLTTKRDFKNAK